jgi:hypothetical protein
LCCIKVGKGGVIGLENRDLHRQFLERLLLLAREGAMLSCLRMSGL